MALEGAIRRESTHARIYRDHKKRVRKIALTLALQDNDVSDIDVLSGILDRELPKLEKKLGIA